MERIRSSVPAWRSKRTRVRVVCTVSAGLARVGGEKQLTDELFY